MKKLFSLVVILAVQAVSSAQSPWVEDIEAYSNGRDNMLEWVLDRI